MPDDREHQHTSDSREEGRRREQRQSYEPPRVEDVPAQDGPAVTAAGVATAADN